MNKVLTKASRIIQSIKYRHFDRFVFIHINKTGGSSIEKALNIPLEHKTALEKISEIGHINWTMKHSFTVIRNPWDKVVSHYIIQLDYVKIRLSFMIGLSLPIEIRIHCFSISQKCLCHSQLDY